jgi:hypothetical protein
MKGKGYESTHAEPCLVKKVDENGTVIICVYVDDCLLAGNRKAIDAAINDIETVFEIRRLGSLKEYIGCTMMDMPDGSKKLIQPDMIKKLKKEFGMKVSEESNATTAMGPGTNVERPLENENKLSEENQRQYRKGVGMLIYLVKHSRPEFEQRSERTIQGNGWCDRATFTVDVQSGEICVRCT